MSPSSHPTPYLGQLLRDHGVDTLFEAAVVLPQRLDVDHRVDNSALVHLVDRGRNLGLCEYESHLSDSCNFLVFSEIPNRVDTLPREAMYSGVK